MNTYKIELYIEKGEKVYDLSEYWSGYDEKTAIAQAFLYYAQNGARAVKVLSIELIRSN